MVNAKTIKTDILIVGAGLIGSAVAMHLSRLGVSGITVVDLDLAGEWSSSELNAGGVRATWSQEVNLLLSKLSIEYFSTVAEEVGYRDCGYLWLHRKETWNAALLAREMHVSRGWPVQVLDVKAIQAKVPFIDKTDDLVGAIFGERDGLVNPNRLKEHYREQAMKNGVWVCEASLKPKISVRAFQFSKQLASHEKLKLLTENPKNLESEQGEWIQIVAEKAVNAAGAWALHLAQVFGYSCPSEPVRKQISLFHAREVDLTPYGMIIDPSGVYFHPESIYGLSGFAQAGEAPGFQFEYDADHFFENYIWSHLHERATVFESLKHVSGWSGLYENSPDHHAIVGSVQQSGLYEAHSFSGHGAMQSYAAGLALSELMVKGRYETIDLASLSAERFLNGKAIPGESWVI